MALFPSALDTLLGLQQALDSFRASGWLDAGPSGAGAYPPINVFRNGNDFALVAEVPGIAKSDLEIEVKGRTIRIAGSKTMRYPERASLHRQERLAGRFDRALTLPFDIDADGVKAESHEGILVVLLPRAAHERPKAIKVN
ncbi:MAG: Hsp20/alpha crystallin family protein [Rhodospirillales bacterium]|nr:Hsp20/alpha crystallin family protein [Rhodospirillales bacterium]